MTLQALIILIIVGAIAGWLAGVIVKGVGFGLVGNIIVGIVGAFIGTWVLGALGVMIGGGIIASIINATIGAVILLLIISFVKRAWIPRSTPGNLAAGGKVRPDGPLDVALQQTVGQNVGIRPSMRDKTQRV